MMNKTQSYLAPIEMKNTYFIMNLLTVLFLDMEREEKKVTEQYAQKQRKDEES
jgi:hypothetical protein